MSLLVILSTYAMEDGQTATSVPHHHNWDTLKLSLHPSTKTTILRSRLSITVDPLIALVMWKSDVLHFSIGDS